MLAKRMANSLSDEGIITDEEKEIVQFGLENLVGNLLGFVMTLTIGFWFHRSKDALLLWLLMFPLRKNVGGFHASTKTRCFLISAFLMILSFTIYTALSCTYILYVTSVLIMGSIIWILAPIDNPSKKLDAVEYKIYRIRGRNILVLESIIFMQAVYFKWEIVVRSIAMTFFLVSLSLLMGASKLLTHNKMDG